MLERLAMNLGRNDENPNIELAELLVANRDKKGIDEIVQGLDMKEGIANDCIKVLYEIGEREPLFIADYVDQFLRLLKSKNNRLVWGSMTALSLIAEYKSDEIYGQIGLLKYAYEHGSVITIDNSMTVFAKLCKADKKYEEEIFPFLLEHLKNCRPKEVAQHAERISVCINSKNRKDFTEALRQRKNDMTPAQLKRTDKLIKKTDKL